MSLRLIDTEKCENLLTNLCISITTFNYIICIKIYEINRWFLDILFHLFYQCLHLLFTYYHQNFINKNFIKVLQNIELLYKAFKMYWIKANYRNVCYCLSLCKIKIYWLLYWFDNIELYTDFVALIDAVERLKRDVNGL
jgi:hypothetical protein